MLPPPSLLNPVPLLPCTHTCAHAHYTHMCECRASATPVPSELRRPFPPSSGPGCCQRDLCGTGAPEPRAPVWRSLGGGGVFGSREDVRQAPKVLSRKGLLERKISRPKPNRVPAIKASPSPNKTPNLDATALGKRGMRQDRGPGQGGVRPGRGFRVRTWLHISGDSWGFVPTWVGLAGYPRREHRGGGAETCQKKRAALTEAPGFSEQAGLRRPALRRLCTLSGGKEERPRPGKRRRRAREPRPHQCAHKRSCHSTAAPRTTTGGAASSHTHSSYILFCCIFRVDK